MSMQRTSGAPRPYRTIAGVVPVRDGWLVAHAKTQGTVARTQEPDVVASFLDIVDTKPGYDVIAVFAPIGLQPHGA